MSVVLSFLVVEAPSLGSAVGVTWANSSLFSEYTAIVGSGYTAIVSQW